MTTPNDLISLKEARTILNVSDYKMTSLVKEKALRLYTYPLDKRKKLVSKAEVESLKVPRPEAA